MESVTGIVLWAVLAIVLLGWVPAKASRSMAKADEHRADRFSTSMHIVNLDDATRPGDDAYGARAMNKTYGADARAQLERETRMQSQNTARLAKLTDERIREIRSLRRAGIRRRRFIVIALMLVSAITFGVSFAVPYAHAWTLVPLVLLVVVLLAGVRAGRQAREWEANLARVRAERRKQAEAREQSITSGSRDGASRGAARDGGRDVDAGAAHENRDAIPTEPLSMEELKQVLRQRAAEQARQEARRKQQEVQEQEALRAQAAKARQKAAREAQERKRLEERRAREAADRAVAQGAAQEPEAGPHVAVAQDAQDVRNARIDGRAGKTVVRPRRVGADMEQIADPDPLYAEMASAPKANTISSVPELISFSLGQARNKVVEPTPEPEPLSAPIKSVRQVAVAVEKESVEPPAESMVDGVPVSALRGDADAASPEVAEASGNADAGSAHSERPKLVLVDGRRAFDEVEPPAESSDSLGLDVDSVIARRRG